MDSFELNKIAGALLFTLLLVMGLGFLAEILYAPPELERQAYVIDVPEEAETGGAEEPEAEPLPVVLARGEVDAGQSVARKCAACHTFEEGEPSKIGPNLHGVVGRPVASFEGFAYSDAMRERGAEGKTWTYEDLYAFLEAPKTFVPGTIMAFAGLKKPEDRADIIAYLRSISPDAPPLPEPPPAADQAAAPPPQGDGEAAPAGEAPPSGATPPDGEAAPAGEAPAAGGGRAGAEQGDTAPGGATGGGGGAQTAPEAAPGAPAPQNEAPAGQPAQ